MRLPRRASGAAVLPLAILLALLAPVAPNASGAEAPAGEPLKRIAFGSCLRQDDRQPVWAPLLKFDPQLFLFLGEAIYPESKDPQKVKEAYQVLAAVPLFRTFREKVPVMATWDESDFGTKDGQGDAEAKEESRKLFLDFWGEPKGSPRWSRPGVYDARLFGPPGRRVQVILLDTRFNRSRLKKRWPWDLAFGPYAPDRDPKKTFLGPEQWAWLKEQLLVPAEIRLLCSSIQVVSSNHDYEKWGNFPLERSRLFELLRETRATGVVVLSGDRHLAEISSANAGIGYPLLDFTSSGLNVAVWNLRPAEENDHRVDGPFRDNNFGAILLEWDAGILTLQARSEDGIVRFERKIPFAELRPQPTPAAVPLVPLVPPVPLVPLVPPVPPVPASAPASTPTPPASR